MRNVAQIFQSQEKVGRLESVVVKDRKESKNKESLPIVVVVVSLGFSSSTLSNIFPFLFFAFISSSLAFLCMFCGGTSKAANVSGYSQPRQAGSPATHIDRHDGMLSSKWREKGEKQLLDGQQRPHHHHHHLPW
jgi:hypothetical protein